MTTKIILDVDTGTDDAVALMTAALSPDIDLIGATTVNGNTTIEYTTENTLRVFDWIGMPEIPVYRGMDRPLVRTDVKRGMAARIHGDMLDLPPVSHGATLQPTHAVDWLIETYLASNRDIVLCPVGPLTNIAMAIQGAAHRRVHPRDRDHGRRARPRKHHGLGRVQHLAGSRVGTDRGQLRRADPDGAARRNASGARLHRGRRASSRPRDAGR